ncbi:hypothetical protein GCM10023259_029450 [Thermocatellispora tengchongensis]
MSPAQERLWLLQRLDPDSASYTLHLTRWIRGRPDRGAFLRACDDVVARHESLRSRFAEEQGVPYAVVGPPPSGVADLLHAVDSEHADRLVSEQVNAAFDLAAGPPLRITLIGLGGSEHILCVTMHHIIADRWSLGVFLGDLAACYTARVAGVAPRLPALPVRAGDHALWHRRQAAYGVSYWRDKLAAPPPADLPFQDGEASGQGATHRVLLPADLGRRLERLAKEHRTTLFTVLMAGYQALLARHTGRTDIMVGSAIAGRDRVELEPMIGCISRTVVIRGDLTGDPAFTELVTQVRGEVLDALGNFDVPFERLDAPAEILVPSMLVLHDHDEVSGQAFPGLELAEYDAASRQTEMALMVRVVRYGHWLSVEFSHDTGMFAPQAVRRLADRFVRLLEAVASAPDTPISALDIWTPEDEADIHALAGARDAALPAASPVIRTIAETARRSPEALAVVCGETRLTYGELLSRVDTLAAALRSAGAGPGDVVGVCLPRSTEAIVALLAVWRADAAYLPLDVADPDERIALALADASARHVITRRALPSGQIAIDPAATRSAGGIPAAGGAGPVPAAEGAWPGSGDAAYVIYTSGSTGRPKGVLVEHGAVAARVHWMRSDYGLAPGDRVVQFATLGFDAHVEEIFPTLAAGATLLLLPDGATSLPDVLATEAGRRVTVLDLPTAYWHSLVEELDQIAWPPGLRLVILGGEQVAAAAVRRWRDRFAERVRLVNTYGPTEATVIATAADLDAGAAVGRPPIGRPIGGTTVHVLDGRGEPLPPGVVGELVIGGAGVARGYLGGPAQTAAVFVPDPYGAPGARRYRTGDRARRRADGTLEFLGRLDGQLKVRGFRVEPEEIETRLLAHPQVGQALVTARNGKLVAYVVGTADFTELRWHLERTLPRHFLPGAWVRLDALPLTRGGKVDRAALPEPVIVPAAGHVSARSDAEKLVAGIWEELLGVTDPGVFDDFFSLGGHSLLATRVAARLRRAIGVPVPIRTVFALTTIADLAAGVEELLIEELEKMTDEEAANLLDG